MALAYMISQTPGLREKTTAYTVDHGVRCDSSSEAQNVHKVVSDMGINHRVLTLDALNDTKELSMRQARYSKLITAMNDDQVSTVVTAHTQDDCIETFVVRMLRGSGLFGLAGIQPQVLFNPYTWGGSGVSLRQQLGGNQMSEWTLLRPLLGQTKTDLRNLLVKNSIPWFEDPTNQDVEIAERNLVRKMYYEYPEMIPEEFQAHNVSRLLEKLNQYRNRCEAEASEVSSRLLGASQNQDGSLTLTGEQVGEILTKLPRDTIQLVLRNILSPLSPLSDLSLRLHRLRDLSERFEAGQKFNIAGVDFCPKKGGKWELSREVPRRPADHVIQLTPGYVSLWDNRFFVASDKSQASVEFIDWDKHRELFKSKEELTKARDQARRRNPILVHDDGYSFPALEGGVLNTMPK